MELPKLREFRLKSIELDTEIKLSLCTDILTHQNIEHYLNKMSYSFLERKIKDFVVFIQKNSQQDHSIEKNFHLWIKSEESNYAFLDHKIIIQKRAKRQLNKRIPASVD